jgi:hypothetical protein
MRFVNRDWGTVVAIAMIDTRKITDRRRLCFQSLDEAERWSWAWTISRRWSRIESQRGRMCFGLDPGCSLVTLVARPRNWRASNPGWRWGTACGGRASRIAGLAGLSFDWILLPTVPYTIGMSPKLNDDLVSALDAQGNVPLKTVHPVTGKFYFLVSEERYERLKPLFEDDPLTLEEQRFQLRETGRRAGWDEPVMDAYDEYDEQRSRAQS